jgi:hypothetical protein
MSASCLGLEVSRLARNNADWYRLLDLCGRIDMLIGDADGIYHPAMFRNLLDRGEGADFLHPLIPFGAFPRHYACFD